MSGTRGKDGVNAVLNAGPATLFAENGFTRRRLHFHRKSASLFHGVTFEVGRFFLGERVVPFGLQLWTSSPEVHQLVSGEPFPRSPISGLVTSCTRLDELCGQRGPCPWEVDLENAECIKETASDVCSVVSNYVFPFFDGLRSLNDLQAIYEGKAVDYYSVSILAAIYVLRGRRQAAAEILCEWRSSYTTGPPDLQVSSRADVSRFAERLGISLPPDGFVPVSVQTQLCERLKEECRQLALGIGRYNHAENLYREILTHGPVPAEVDQRYREARRAIWPTMSARQLCRMAEKMCSRAASSPKAEVQDYYDDAHYIFELVKHRDGLPDAYLEIASTAAENAS